MVVTETVDCRDRVWIDTRDPRERGIHCAVTVQRSPEALAVSVGDRLRWQGWDAAFWTPLDRQGRPIGPRDIPLTRIGAVGLPYPVEHVLGFQTAPVFEVGAARYRVGVDWATVERTAWVLSLRRLPWYLEDWGESNPAPRFGDLDQAHCFASRREARVAGLHVYELTRGRCVVVPVCVRVRVRGGERTVEPV